MSRPFERRPQGSGDRLLAALALFTIERPQWTVEAAAAELGVSATTAYRYFKQLTGTGLISPVAGAGYTLGPAIVQMDRQLQATDPMLIAARAVMVDLVQHAAEGSTVLLCRLFHDRVMCMHQVMGRGPQEPVSYERGRLMPLYRGATAKNPGAPADAHAQVSVRSSRLRDHGRRPRPELRRVPPRARDPSSCRCLCHLRRDRSRPDRDRRTDLRSRSRGAGELKPRAAERARRR